MSTFDPDHPTARFKQMLRGLVKGYRFDVEGLYMRDGSIRPLPREASVIGKVLEVSIIEFLSRRLLSVNNLKSIPASSDRVYPDITFNGPLIFPNRFALDVKCARRNKSGGKTVSPITIGTFDAEYFRYPDEKAANIMMPYASYTAHLARREKGDFDSKESFLDFWRAQPISESKVERWTAQREKLKG